MDGNAAVVVRWDEGFDKLPECRPWVSRRFQHRRGDSLKSVLSQFKGFAAVGGSAAFAGGPHNKGLSGGGADNHDIDGTNPVVSISVNDVRSFESIVVRWYHLLPMDEGMPPVVEELMEGVGHRFVAFHSSGTVCAADRVMPFRIAVPRALGAPGPPKGAWARPENVVSRADAHGKFENVVRHEVGGLARKLEPSPSVRSTTRLPPG